jgi:amylosucrase
MLYNVTTMATTWNTVATKDVRLLKKQMDIVNSLPKDYLFLNYLRCHDDLGWGLDYSTLAEWGMDEVTHKRFLNRYFRGLFEGSEGRGELYNDDPVTQDARFCGTTASMCGLESAIFERNGDKIERAVRYDLMLHAYMFTQSGIPMLYSGDEIGQLNDYTYKNDPDKRDDSRYLHRGAFKWNLAELVKEPGTAQQQIFDGLSKLENIRRTRSVFDSSTPTYTYDVKDDAILGILRENDEERFVALFNFADQDRTAWINEQGTFLNLLTGEEVQLHDVVVGAQDFLWLSRVKNISRK